VSWGLPWAVAVLGWLAGCSRPSGEHHLDAPATSWHYQVRLEPGLQQLEATVCFRGVVPSELRAGKDEAASRLKFARWLSPGARRRLPVSRGRIQLPSEERDGCMEYGVNMVDSGTLEVAVRQVGRDLLASPNAWLWRPERRALDASATLELVLPAGISAVLPWRRRVDGKRELDAEAFRFDSYAAFGRFQPIVERVGEVELEAALLDGVRTMGRELATRWLRNAMHVATLSDGQFPRSRMSAIVMPGAASSEPVQFGMVARGGGASVLLIVSGDASERALLHDWVLPHELSHLLLPFVEREHSWISEGFATYYQEVLLARAGLITDSEALRRFASSLRSEAGRAGETSLVDESAQLELTRDYRKVYWGGAAYWLSLDVALRGQGISLDGLLARVRQDDAARGLWTARELVARLDSLAGSPLFSRGFEQAASQPFPSFEPALSALSEQPELRSQLFTLRADER
jgi:M61 glycyl aminopeptidase